MNTGSLLDLLVDLGSPPDATPSGLRIALVGIALVICVVIAVIDARHRIIPDEANAGLVALGLVSAGLGGFHPALVAALQGAISFGMFWAFQALYRTTRGREGLGFGDVKFLGAAGVWVGLAGIAPLVLVACAAALGFVGLARLRGEAITGHYALPFGPFLVFGLAVMLIAQPWLAAAD